jgi:hypothetical protein
VLDYGYFIDDLGKKASKKGAVAEIYKCLAGIYKPLINASPNFAHI